MAKETLRKSIGAPVKRLSLGAILIILAGGVLLLSDLNQRRPRDKNLRKIAVLQHSSQAILLQRENPLAHPKHFVGIGAFMPVAKGVELARKLFPGLNTVGVVWNPGEANSRAFTMKAREVCARLGVNLIEANVDNSSGVFEAASSLTARRAGVVDRRRRDGDGRSRIGRQRREEGAHRIRVDIAEVAYLS